MLQTIANAITPLVKPADPIVTPAIRGMNGMMELAAPEPEVIVKEQPQIFVVKQSNTILIIAGVALLGLLIWKGKLLK